MDDKFTETHTDTCERKINTLLKSSIDKTGNVKLRSIRVTTVVVERQNVLHIRGRVSSLNYPARNAHALYYIYICVLSGPIISFHIIWQKARNSEKNIVQ